MNDIQVFNNHDGRHREGSVLLHQPFSRQTERSRTMNERKQNEADKLDELSRKTQLLIWLNIASVGTCFAMLLGAILGVLMK